MTCGMLGVLVVQVAVATKVDAAVFAIAAFFVLVGAIGVVVARNPVHAALMLVMTLFGVAVLFVEPLRAQRPLAVGLVASSLAGLLLLGVAAHWSVGAHSVAGQLRGQPGGDVAALGRAVFTTYLFPFEATAALLVIAVVGAVVLARRPPQARRPDREQAAAPGGDGPPGDRTAGDVVGDPMDALAQAVANAVASGLVSLPEDLPEGQRQEEPVGESAAP